MHTAWDIFARAIQWEVVCGISSIAIRQSLPRRQEPIPCVPHVPIAVGAAFAVELHLKTLLAIDDPGTPQKGHNLVELHSKLPSNLQDDLALAYHFFHWRRNKNRTFPVINVDGKTKVQAGPLEPTVESAIKRMNGLFVKWRYAYEEGNFNLAETNDPGIELNSSLIHTIIKREPEWCDWARESLNMQQYFGPLGVCAQYFPIEVFMPCELEPLFCKSTGGRGRSEAKPPVNHNKGAHSAAPGAPADASDPGHPSP